MQNQRKIGFEEISIVRVGTFELAIGHRPKLKALPTLKAMGFSHVVTILGQNEKPADIGRACDSSDLVWHWVNISAGRVPTEPDEVRNWKKSISDVSRLIAEAADVDRVYMHYSAGIHRTGMVIYALLRRLGYQALDARETLEALRPVTAEQVGEERLQYAETIGPLKG